MKMRTYVHNHGLSLSTKVLAGQKGVRDIP